MALHRHIPSFPPDSSFCSKPETCMHVMFHCPRAATVWINSLIPIRSTCLHGECIVRLSGGAPQALLCRSFIFRNHATDCFHLSENLESQLGTTLSSVEQHSYDTVVTAKTYLESFIEATASMIESNDNEPSPPASWRPAPAGMLKANFDAAFDKRTQKGARAVAITNHFGSIVDWRCFSISHAFDPLAMESRACRTAVTWAVDKNIKQFFLKGTVKNSLMPLWVEKPLSISKLQCMISFMSIKEFSMYVESRGPCACN